MYLTQTISRLVGSSCKESGNKLTSFPSQILSAYFSSASSSSPPTLTHPNFHEGQSELRAALLSRDLMGSGSVDLELDEKTRIATVTLNHPEKRNALSGAMMMDLGLATHELSVWRSGLGVVLKGAGKHFCSGPNLNLVKNISNPLDGLLMATYMHSVSTQFYRLPMVTVALVHGNAVGGGADLTTACDFRLLHPDARIGFVQSEMGVSPGWGGGARLVRLVGRSKALKILASGKVLRAGEAQAIGLADEVLDDGNDSSSDSNSSSSSDSSSSSHDAAVEFISKLVGSKDTDVVRTVKMISTVAEEESMKQALEVERTLFSKIWGGKPHLDAMAGNIKHHPGSFPVFQSIDCDYP